VDLAPCAGRWGTPRGLEREPSFAEITLTEPLRKLGYWQSHPARLTACRELGVALMPATRGLAPWCHTTDPSRRVDGQRAGAAPGGGRRRLGMKQRCAYATLWSAATVYRVRCTGRMLMG
jgi:hypothetical protein